MEESLQKVQEAIGYVFGRPELLELALTHSSYANEQELHEPYQNNERLEFLGDAVLELCVSEELFARFTELREGELTRMRARLVSKPTLAAMARELGLQEHLRLGRGEESQGGRTRSSLLSDVFEAVLGALFLDGGYGVARSWVCRVFEGRWPERPEAVHGKDYKSRLQEITQRRYKSRPVYSLTDSSGPEHAKRFRVCLTLPDGETVAAEGRSVKAAEQKAAAMAVELLERGDAAGADGEEGTG